MPPRLKRQIPLAVSVLALALAIWWAWTSVRDAAEGDTVEHTRLPADLLEPETPPEDPAPEPVEAEPSAPLLGNPPPPVPPPPPERIVPDVVPPEEEEDPPPAPEPGEGVDRQSGRSDDLKTTSGESRLLGGVARTNARATPEVRVPRGAAWIGTPWRWVSGTERVVGAGTYPGLTMEAPRHVVRMDEFFIDRFEVSNFHYWQFLDRTARAVYRTLSTNRATLPEIARALIRDPAENLDYDRVGRQIYESNKGLLRNAFRSFIVVDRDGVVDEDATWRRIRERRVPGGLRLSFYDRAPPGTWPSKRFLEREIDHPVRGVSPDEAMEFALYRGRHVPTEYEWEYAARGRHGRDFPWDPNGREFSSHVNGGDPLPRGTDPRTVPVTHFGQGASWIGVFQMLGNVSEFTSSYLDLYPNGALEAGLAAGANVVVRGGSADDRERVPVRPAFRGWARGEPEGGPRPGLRLPWTGFRTARYEEVARSRIPTMHFRARRTGQLDPAALEPRIYEGAQGVLEEAQFFDGQDVATTRPGVKSFVAQPLKMIAIRWPGDRTFRPGREHGLLHRDDLIRHSHAEGSVLLGLFHNDIALESTWYVVPDSRGGPLRFEEARCPPGTWFVALWQGHLALIGTDMRRVYVLTAPRRDVPVSLFNVLDRIKPEASVRLRVQRRGGDVLFTLGVPLGGTETARALATVVLRLKADRRATFAVERWLPGRMR